MDQALNQLGRHNIPNPELLCAHQCTGYSSSYITWARQTALGNTSGTTTTASAAVALITLGALDSCAVLVVRDSKGYRVDGGGQVEGELNQCSYFPASSSV